MLWDALGCSEGDFWWQLRPGVARWHRARARHPWIMKVVMDVRPDSVGTCCWPATSAPESPFFPSFLPLLSSSPFFLSFLPLLSFPPPLSLSLSLSFPAFLHPPFWSSFYLVFLASHPATPFPDSWKRQNGDDSRKNVAGKRQTFGSNKQMNKYTSTRENERHAVNGLLAPPSSAPPDTFSYVSDGFQFDFRNFEKWTLLNWQPRLGSAFQSFVWTELCSSKPSGIESRVISHWISLDWKLAAKFPKYCRKWSDYNNCKKWTLLRKRFRVGWMFEMMDSLKFSAF